MQNTNVLSVLKTDKQTDDEQIKKTTKKPPDKQIFKAQNKN